MFEELNAHRQAVRENIEKAFEVGFTGNDDLEKAHQVGDIHPNGKLVWTQLPSGRYDWRVIKKNTAEKKQEKAFNDALKADKVKSSSKKNPSELETISEVEDYAKSISGVTFKSVKTGWSDGNKDAKAFELTYPHGGKMRVDFRDNRQYVYELTDSNENIIISTDFTDETSRTDWSIQLNPDKLVARRVEALNAKLTKLKREEAKAKSKRFRGNGSFDDRYAYKKASEAVSDMKTKIQELQSLIGTF